jgi:hypothetical protein
MERCLCFEHIGLILLVRNILKGEKAMELNREQIEAIQKSHWMVRDYIRKLTEENERLRSNSIAIPEGGIGNLSDGYHTFNELYHHRAILFAVICNSMPDKAWKSKLHDTGDMYDGMFIIGIETLEGQATYHYDINPYWDMFKVKELEKAPKWDGHTPQMAIDRISRLSANVATRDDTVRKMLQRIKEDAVAVSLLSNPPKFMLEIREDALDQIAKEVLGESK